MKVSASYSQEISLNNKIMYIPEGTHDINPTVDGKPGSIVSKVDAARGEAIVEALNKALNKRNSKNVRPIVDFDHKDIGPAAGLPKEFSYEPGMGIMLELEWTKSGTSAIEGKDYSYFSPVYNMDRNTGEPVGLPSSGPIGALVNDPAFREIKRIAAAKTANPTPEMETSVLVTAGLITEAEAKTDKVAEITAANISVIQVEAAKVAGLESEVSTLKASLAKVAETTADRAIEDAVKTGRIAAKDETTKSFWREQLVEASANPEKYETVSAALSSIAKADVTGQIVKLEAGDTKSLSTDQRIEAAQSKARTELGSGAKFQAVWEKAQELDPSAFAE